jgi:hypothetical protein
VRPAGVEPTTFGSGGRRSIQLSYGRAESEISHRSHQFSQRKISQRTPALDLDLPAITQTVRRTVPSNRKIQAFVGTAGGNVPVAFWRAPLKISLPPREPIPAGGSL